MPPLKDTQTLRVLAKTLSTDEDLAEVCQGSLPRVSAWRMAAAVWTEGKKVQEGSLRNILFSTIMAFPLRVVFHCIGA